VFGSIGDEWLAGVEAGRISRRKGRSAMLASGLHQGASLVLASQGLAGPRGNAEAVIATEYA
jgi:hypothetical protein